MIFFLKHLFLITVAQAESVYDSDLIKGFGQSAGWQISGFDNNPIENTIAFFINFALAFVGIILLVLTLKAGFSWMMARDDKEVINSSKKTLSGCVVGLIIILSSYTVSNFVITKINKAERNNAIINGQNTGGGIGIDPGHLSQTVCQNNSDCPAEAPYCTGKDWYTGYVGYCNCCDDNLDGHSCSDSGRNAYCIAQFGSQAASGQSAKCINIGNGFNTSCVLTCNTDSDCPLNYHCGNNEYCYKNQ
jgi:hypothetical protein